MRLRKYLQFSKRSRQCLCVLHQPTRSSFHKTCHGLHSKHLFAVIVSLQQAGDPFEAKEGDRESCENYGGSDDECVHVCLSELSALGVIGVDALADELDSVEGDLDDTDDLLYGVQKIEEIISELTSGPRVLGEHDDRLSVLREV